MFKKFCAVFIIFLMVFSIINLGFSSENIPDGTNTGVENLVADKDLASVDLQTISSSSYNSHPVYICISGYVENYSPTMIHDSGCTVAIINARCSGLNDNKIQEFKNAGLKVYLYVPSFFNHDNSKWDMNLNNAKNRVAPYIDRANSNANIDGIILDYVRSPNAYGNNQYLVCDLVKFSRDRLNGGKTLGAFIMPESCGPEIYGQNIDLMKPNLDEIIVMAYKGNYRTNYEWIKNIMGYFQGKVADSNCKASAIVQSYRSDSDTTKLPRAELYADMNKVIEGGGYGTGLFRAGLNNLDPNNPYKP